MKHTYWQKRKHNAKKVYIDITKALTCLSLACTVSLTPCYAQQIITDGNTSTTLNTNGTITDVTTTTIKGNNAFNSFTKFNVDTGNTVNLVVPNSSENLINIVTGEQTIIKGVLNSIKHDEIGGNIFLANPHGISTINGGVINVGSITAITPTADFTNNFFNGVGDPNDASVVALLNGTVPINPDATITAGRINAITNVTLEAGNVTNYGDIYTNAKFGPDIETGDIVNLNSLEYTEHHAPQNLVLENGEIKIKAVNELNQRGGIYSGGDIELTSDDKLYLGDIDAYYGRYHTETYSGKGDINLTGETKVNISQSYVTSGNNIFITQNTRDDEYFGVNIHDASITAAHNIEMNVVDSQMYSFDNSDFPGGSQVPTLLKAGEDVIINAEHGAAFIIDAGGNVVITSEGVDNYPEIMNHSSAGVGGKIKAIGDILVNSNNGDASISAESVNGNIEINCDNFGLSNLHNTNEGYFDPNLGITTDYSLKAAGDITINAQNNFIVDYADIRAGNDITINASINPDPQNRIFGVLGNSNIISNTGNINISYDYSRLDLYGNVRSGIAGDTKLGYLSSPTIQTAGDINISSPYEIYLAGGATITGNNITFESSLISLGPEIIYSEPLFDIQTQEMIGIYTEVLSPTGATINGNNVTISQQESPWLEYNLYYSYLSTYGLDATISGLLTIDKSNNTSQVDFAPSSINTGSFSSNFIAPNSDIALDGYGIGNLDHIIIGGAPFNPSNITLVNSSLCGDITTTGNIDLTNVNILDGTNLHSDSGITINTLTPDQLSFLNIEGGNISTNGLLTLNAGNILTSGIRFTPDSITAGSLSSDFLVQNGDLNIISNKSIDYNADVYWLPKFGNIDNITIGGQPLNPTNININAGVDGQMALYGGLTTTGNINIAGKWLQFDDTASLNAGGNISINPTGRLDFNAATINTPNQLTLNAVNVLDNSLIFTPESIVAGSLVSDFLTQNGAIAITSNESLNIANLNAITIGGSGLNITDLTLTAGEIATIGGAITVSNNIDLTGKIVEVSAGSTINAGNNLTLDPTEAIKVNGGNIIVTNLLTLNRGSSNILGLVLQADSITAGSLSSDFLTQNGDLDLTDITDGEIRLLNLDDNITIGGNPLNLANLILSQEESNVEVIIGNIELAGSLHAYSTNIFILGDITTDGSISIENIGKVVIAPDTTLTAGKDIQFTRGWGFSYADVNVTIGANSVLDAQNYLSIVGSSELPNKLTIEPGVQLISNGRLGIGNFTDIILDDVSLYAGGNTYLEFVEYIHEQEFEIWADVTNSIRVTALNDINITGGTTLETDNNNVVLTSFNSNINIDGASTIISGNDIAFDCIYNVNIGGGASLNATNDISIETRMPPIRYVQDKIVNLGSDTTLTAGNNVTISADREILLDGLITADNLTSITSTYGDIHSTNVNSLITTKDITLSAEYGKIEGINVDLTASKVNAVAFNNIEIAELDSDIDVGIIKSRYGDVILSTAGGSILLDSNARITAGRMVDLDAYQNIVVDGIITAYAGGFDYRLLINADGSIDPSSTIGATILGGNIDVDNLTNATAAGINITGNVTGSGTLQVSNGYADIDITNDSDNSLTINDLDNKVIGQIVINSTLVTEDFGGITVVLDPTYNDLGQIDITNNTTSNILIAGNILIEVNSVNVINLGGSILDDGGLITAPDINLIANNGSIGLSDQPIVIDLTASTLNATALNGISISELDSNIDVISVQSINGNVYLESPQSITLLKNALVSGNDINLITNDYIIDQTASITANNNVIFSRATAGNLEVSDTGNLTPQGIGRVNGNIIIGNHTDTNSLTNNIDINSNVYTDGDPITFNADGTITVLDNVIVSTRDLPDVWSDNHLTEDSEGNSGKIVFTAENLNLNADSIITALSDGFFSSGDIDVDIVNNLSAQNAFKANTIRLNANIINASGMTTYSSNDHDDQQGTCLTANTINLNDATYIFTFGDIVLKSDNYNIDSSTTLGATNLTIFSRATAGDIEISDIGLITPQMISLADNVQIGNYIDNDLTENITIKSNIYTNGCHLTLVNNDTLTLDANIIISTRILNDVWTENHLTALSQDNSGTLFLASDGAIDLKESSAILANANNGFIGGWVETPSAAQSISTSALIKADRISLGVLNNININGDMIADTSLSLYTDSGDITQTNSSLMAPNINLTAANGAVGNTSDYIIVESNNSSIDINAYGNIYLDALYGDNIFSLKSTTGITYLKMHNNIPEPGASIFIPAPPVVEVPIIELIPDEIVINPIDTPIIEQPVQPEEDVINIIEEQEPQEVVENITPEAVINVKEEVDQPIIVVNDPIIEINPTDNNKININNNAELPVNPSNEITNSINSTDTNLIITTIPVMPSMVADNAVQLTLNKAIIVYNEALLSGIDPNNAIDIAINVLIDSNITREKAKELIDSQLIKDNAYIEMLEHFVSLNKVSIAR